MLHPVNSHLGAMKRQRGALLLILALSLAGISSLPTASLKQESKPILGETLDWLKKMLATRAGYVKKYAGISPLVNKLDSVNFEDCTLSYRDVVGSQGRDKVIEDQVFSFAIPIGELDSSRVKVEKDGDRAKLILTTTGDRPVIKGSAKWKVAIGNGYEYSSAESGHQSRVVINFDGFEIAEQVAAAFRQAVKLCQKNKGSAELQHFI